jgi:hypothetical protein
MSHASKTRRRPPAGRVLASVIALIVAAGAVWHLGVLIAGALVAVAPLGASVSVPVTVTGTGFNAIASSNEVAFAQAGGVTVTTPGQVITPPDASGRRRLTVRVPAGLTPGRAAISIRNTVSGETSAGIALEVLEITLPEVSSAASGTTGVKVRIAGSANMRFLSGATAVSFRSGITVTSVVVESPTSLVAVVNVGSTAAPGGSHVQVKTATQTALSVDGFQVTVPPMNHQPTALAGGPYTAMVGQPITFEGGGSSDPDMDPLTFMWSFGDGSTALGINPAHTYQQPGVFTVTLTVDDGRGGQHSASTTATIAETGDGLPPDPGEAGKATLQGIDTDGDGLRDDLQRHIFMRYPDSPPTSAALVQIALALQRSIVSDDTPGSANAIAVELGDALDCLMHVTGSGARSEMGELLATALNTYERTREYLAFNGRLSGLVLPLRPVSERGSACQP